MQIRVICKNHGIIKTYEMDCMWVGIPPMPEMYNKYCPICGKRTIIERDERVSGVYTYSRKDFAETKQREVEFYKKKYWGEE